MAPRRILRALIFDYVATHSGWLKSTDLRQKGACNQGKRHLRANSTQSGATPPSVTTGENQGLRGETSTRHKVPFVYACSIFCVLLLFGDCEPSHLTTSSQTKKKSPRNRLFSTFLCRTLKRICVSVVWQEQIKTSSRYDGCKAKSFYSMPRYDLALM